MKIHEYNEMMSYLMRPAPKVQTASLMDEYLGDQKEYQRAVDEGFQGTYEEYLQIKSLERTNLAIGGGVIEGEDLGSREGFAKILRSPTGQNLSIENYPKNLLNIIDETLKQKPNIILNYTLDEINKLLKPFDVQIGKTALRKRVSQLNLDDKILRGKIKGVEYKPSPLSEKSLIVEDFVKETNKKILEGYQNKKLGKVYDVDLGTDLAKKLGKGVTPTQALSVIRNHQNKSQTEKLLNVDEVRMRIGNEIVEKYNKELPFISKREVLNEAGYPKGSRWTLNKLDSREDKIVKATEILFKDPATKAEDLFNPYQKIAKLINPSERKGTRGGVERIRVDDVSKVVNENFPDLEPTIKKLSNANVKQKILNSVKKGQIITLEDIETGLRKGTGLPFGRNVYSRMVMHAARHQEQAPPGKALTQFYDENGKIIRNVNNIDSYANVTFKYRPNTSVDFNKIKEVYGVSRGLVEIPKGANFVDLTFQAEKLPQFKEYFSKVEEIENLKRREVIHPITKKRIPFAILMGEAYQKGAGYKNPYARFPYDIDHKFGVVKDPFKNLRVISQRLNVGGGQAKFRDNQKVLQKMGYNFDKDIEKLFQDEVKLAEKVLVKGRKLKTAFDAAKLTQVPAKLKPIVLGTGFLIGGTIASRAGETDTLPFGVLPQGSPAQINPVDEEGFTDTEKLLAGTTAGAAAIAARKPILRTLGKVVRPFGFPSVAAGFALNELTGEDPNLGIAGAELLAPELIKTVAPRGTGILSQIGRFAANPFFKGARAFTPIGLGLMGIEGVRMGMREQDRIDAMSPEEREDFIAEQESLLDFSA